MGIRTHRCEKLFRIGRLDDPDGSGGALKTGIPTTLTNVSVTDSHGGYSGGGISASASLTMTDCTVSGNETGHQNPSTGYWNASGGGIAGSGTPEHDPLHRDRQHGHDRRGLAGLQFLGRWHPHDRPLHAHDCEVTDNTAYQGGGLRHTAERGTISGSTFSGNSATSGAYTGSTMTAAAPSIMYTGTMTLTDNTNVTGNAADGDGGGIYVAGGALTVSGGKIGWRDTGTNNTAAGNGGGIYQAGGTVTLNSTVLVYGNTAVNGAGLYVMGGTLTVTGANIGSTAMGEGNVASGDGGGVYRRGLRHAADVDHGGMHRRQPGGAGRRRLRQRRHDDDHRRQHHEQYGHDGRRRRLCRGRHGDPRLHLDVVSTPRPTGPASMSRAAR